MYRNIGLEPRQVSKIIVANPFATVLWTAHSLQCRIMCNDDLPIFGEVNITLHQVETTRHCVLECISRILGPLTAATSVSSI